MEMASESRPQQGGSGLVFQAENQHSPSCGPPPQWTLGKPRAIMSYFENSFGEQWIACVERDRFRLTGGDIGWKTIEVAHPDYAALAEEQEEQRKGGVVARTFHDHIFNVEEALWLQAVLTAAGRIPFAGQST
jgi:hypothetical protein